MTRKRKINAVVASSDSPFRFSQVIEFVPGDSITLSLDCKAYGRVLIFEECPVNGDNDSDLPF